MANILKPPVYRVSLAQAVVLLPLSLLSWLFDGTTAYSVLLGGLACLVPHAYFTSYAFRYTGARAAPLIARAFFWGETGKFLLTVVGFGMIFLLVKPLNIAALFLAYSVMLVVQWIVSAKLTSP